MNVIIIGASTRAAAFSAHRAGLEPWCVDLFADADLAHRFPVRRIGQQDYPNGFLDALRDAPDGPVLYTGGLESYPDLLARIGRPLWGNPPEVLRRVRDPYLLTRTLRRHSLPALKVRRSPPLPGDKRRWLIKPLRGSGGVGIRHYEEGRFDPTVHYLQKYAEGYALSGLFLGVPGRDAIYLGAIIDEMGFVATYAPAFHYAGGIATRKPGKKLLLEQLGLIVAREFGLVGLFGIDTIVALSSHNALIVDVNPRYTASVELLERGLNRSLLDLHATVFRGGTVEWDPEQVAFRTVHGNGHRTPSHRAGGVPMVPGKGIVYARQALRFPEHGPWEVAFHQPAGAVEYADIPVPGTWIRKGHPVLTVFAEGVEYPSVGFPYATCLHQLQSRVQGLDPYLYG
jgi:predicted ATP-grasp superfamily ATP-dependent carboligase